MTTRLVLRRIAIMVACLLAVGGLVGVVRTAAVLRADAAPLVAAPVSAEQIAAEIEAESARSAELSAVLTTLEARTGDIDNSLSAAGDQMTTDAAAAARLRDDLAVAKDRLTTLQGQLAAAQARLIRLIAAGKAAAANTTATTTTSRPVAHDEDEGESGDD